MMAKQDSNLMMFTRFLTYYGLCVLLITIFIPGTTGDQKIVNFEGQDITLQCKHTQLASNLTVQWLKDSANLDVLGSKYTKLEDDSLKVTKAALSDAGIYVCNINGVEKERYNVVIHSKPEFTELFQQKKVMAGTTTKLQCRSVGQPIPIIKWFKDGSEIINDIGIKISTAVDNTSSSVNSQLVLQQASLWNTGIYKCTAGNLYGVIEHEATVQVYSAAKITLKPEDGVTGINKEYAFTCKAEGSPAPSIAWIVGSTVLYNNSWFGIVTKHDGFITESILTIKSARRVDHGVYRCFAVNSFGNGTAEAKLQVFEKPDPVSLKVTKIGVTWIEAEWTPGFNGNVKIEEYIIFYNSTIFMSSKRTSETNIRLENLEPETKYMIGVSASNIIGRSEMAVVCATTATDYLPSVITVNVSKITSTTFTVGWMRKATGHMIGKEYGVEIVLYAGNSVFRNETIRLKEPNGITTMKGLNPYTKYSVIVREVYKLIFKGPFTQMTNVTTKEDVPGKPNNLTALGIAKDKILVIWNPPFRLNGIIREYGIKYMYLDEVYAMVSRQKTVLTKDQKDRRVVLDNLTAFTLYHIKVRERTLPQHWGPETDVYMRTLEDVPSNPPNNTQVKKLNDTAFMLSWDPIQAHKVRGNLTAYKVVSVRQGIVKREEYILNIATTRLVLSNLDPYTVYKVRIAGMTGAGSGPAKLVTIQTPEGVPSKPRSVFSSTSSGNSITLEWQPPAKENGIILRYQVLCKKLGFIRRKRSVGDTDERKMEGVVEAGRRRRHVVDKLEPFTMYRFRIRESTKKGWGPFSVFVNSSTTESKPSKPLLLKVETTTERGAVVSWKKPAKPNGRIKYYLLFCWDGISLVQDLKVYKPLNLTLGTFQAKIDKLESGKSYVVEVRAMNSFMGNPEQVTAITTRKVKATNKELFPWLPLISGCVGGIILIALITATALLCTRKKKYSEIDGNVDDTPMNGFIKNRPIHIAHLKHYVQQNHANSDHGFYTEYESIKVPINTFTWENSQQPYNQQKNRYSNIVAYDHSRVVLSNVDNNPGSSYINASFIDGYKSPRKFIATQGPLPHTINDFWRMVWEQKSHVVVMLTKLVEDSRVKCEQYWPEQGSVTYKNFLLTAEGRVEMTDYMLRTFSLSNINESLQPKREILHYHFTAWPDYGVPEHPTAMVMFIRHVMGSISTKPGPIIVHCSAGVGRTGTFIVIDSMLHQIKEESVVDVFGFVSHVRRQRNFMVQTEAQYIFIYDALLDAVICGNTEIAAQDLFSKLRYLNQQDPETGETYLRDEFKRLEAGPGLTDNVQFVVASHSDNKMKNRFLNILPYDRNRVRLAQIAGIRGSDYINASNIDGFQKRRAFIATQAPLSGTLNDFWRMVWEQNCHCIVMLTKLSEKGQERCHQYWPTYGTEMYGKIMVDNLGEKDHGEFMSRDFHVTHTESGKSRKIRHFLLLSWPQHGSPSSGASMIQLIGEVQKSKHESGSRPIVVHCSGGVGRTGAFIALCISIERLKVEGIIDLFQTIRQLRTQRPAMVQTIDQYYFCYQALKDYLDSFDLYSSFA